MDKRRTLIIIFFFLVITLCVQIAGATPISSFNMNLAGGFVPLTEHFTDTSSGNPNCWQWNFGDGSTSNVQNPTHIYNSIGTYAVTLDVGTDGNYVTTSSETVYVYPMMQASYSVTPSSGIAPLTVHLTDTSTGNPTWWEWQIQKGGPGDPPPSYEQNPTFVLTTPGEYGVYLQISGHGTGAVKQDYRIINVALPYTGTITPTQSIVSPTMTTEYPTISSTTIAPITVTTIATTVPTTIPSIITIPTTAVISLENISIKKTKTQVYYPRCFFRNGNSYKYHSIICSN